MQRCPSMVDTTLYRLFSSKKLSFSDGSILHRRIRRAMLAQTDLDNIPDYFSAQICLWAVSQNVQVIF